MNGLIGYTGFVGQNLDGPEFSRRYNSKNIEDIRGERFDLLVCAGVPGHKTVANRFPQKDWDSISRLMDCLSHVRCSSFVLISTIDVLPDGIEADEDHPLLKEGLTAYGVHRARMEAFIQNCFENVSVIRLPGIFGKGLRKNFIFDLIFQIPRMFSQSDFQKLQQTVPPDQAECLASSYQMDGNGMFALRSALPPDILAALRGIVMENHCSSLRFTDCRNVFSYYDLAWLRRDLHRILDLHIPLIHMVTEPMSAAEVAESAFDIPFSNIIDGKTPLSFHLKSKYAPLWGHTNGYLYTKEQVICRLRQFDRSSIQI